MKETGERQEKDIILWNEEDMPLFVAKAVSFIAPGS